MKIIVQTAAVVAASVFSLAAAHAQKAPVKLAVDSKLANPKTLPVVSGTTDTSASKMGFQCGGHFVGKPVAILDVKTVTKLSVRVKGGPGTIAAKIGSGGVCNETQTRSETPEILLEQWPAGIAEIYIGDTASNRTLQATIIVEDLSRPADLDWGPIARVSVDGPPASVTIGHAETAGKSRSSAPRVVGCSATYRDQPDLILDVTKAVSSLQVIARSIDAEEIMLIGPVPPDHRRIPMQCQGSNSKSSDGSFDVEPGMYGVKVADKGRATFVNIAVSAKGAKPESAKVTPIVPAKVALAERDLLLHYPHLTLEALLRSDELRWSMFATAPPQLFAYLATDLANGDGFHRYSGDSASAATWPVADAPALEYPKAGEPVLVVGNTVLTADGLVFGAATNKLAATAPGALVFPSKTRDPIASFAQSTTLAGSEDAAVVQKHAAAQKKYDACAMKIDGPVADKMMAMQADGLTVSEERQIEALQVQTRKRVESTCKSAALTKLRDATWTALIKTRTARREKALAAARTRLEQGR